MLGLMLRISSYKFIANEYYDESLHPTCASLGRVSHNFLIDIVKSKYTGLALEVGAGRGLDIPNEGNIVALDSSQEMMKNNKSPKKVVSDALSMPFSDGQFDYIFGSLIDPFSVDRFYNEAHRVIKKNGSLIFTLPSYEWASSFRSQERRQYAEFLHSEGYVLQMPSFVASPAEQIDKITRAGFSSVRHIPVKASIGDSVAPKLEYAAAKRFSLVDGFVASD